MEAKSVEEIGVQAEAFFKDFLPISYEWIKHALPGISQRGKELIRQYWERGPEMSVDEEEFDNQIKQDTVLTAELLAQGAENERQALFGIMGALKIMKITGESLVKIAPDLFKS